MKNKKIRGILILAVLIVTAYFVAPLLVDNLPKFWTEKRLKLGLDLQGGSQILLEVDYSKLKLSNKEKEDAVKTALEIIRNRINKFGVSEPSIQRVGNNRIVVQLPGLEDPSRAKELIGKTAQLEFKLLADSERLEETLDNLDTYLKNNLDKYPSIKESLQDEDFEDAEDIFSSDTASTETEDMFAETKDEAEKTKADSEKAMMETEEEAEEDMEYAKPFTDLISSDQGATMLVDYENVSILKTLLADKSFTKQIPAGLELVIGKVNKNDPYAARPVFLLHKKAELTGKYLEEATVKINKGYDPNTSGKPEVALSFNRRGSEIFEDVTGEHIEERLAIVLDDVVYVAPRIQDRIRGGNAVINGDFTMAECQDLAIVLNAGNLPAPVNIIEERTVGPSLGSDSIKAGILAALIGMIAIILFMIIYYKLSGLFADIAVVINIGFILAVLTMFDATLTMPGIAGMILTIGMAVDANVIIFERIRENLDQGKTVRTAVDSGFDRALVTILDANITTLITALVLYQFGTGPIRGFAVTLSIGIIGSMFASIVMVKAIFDGLITNKKRDSLSI